MALRKELQSPATGPEVVDPTKRSITIWLDKPITTMMIDIAAIVFDDFNDVHMSDDAAIAAFGRKATGRVAHGMLILGQIGGAVGRHYGPGTQAREITDVKFSWPFCPGDLPGMRLKEVSRQVKLGLTYVTVEIEILHRRGDAVVAVSKNKPLRLEIVYPSKNDERQLPQ